MTFDQSLAILIEAGLTRWTDNTADRDLKRALEICIRYQSLAPVPPPSALSSFKCWTRG